jgi:hypothetical protein
MFRRITASLPLLALVFAVASPAQAVGRFVPGDFATIQAAIDASASGDVITVAPGTYTENLTLKSGVDVRGREAARTLIAPADSGDPAVLANGVDDVTFGNFTLIDAQVAVDLIDATNMEIVNTVFDTATTVALRVDIDSQVDILNNVFVDAGVALSRATSDAQVTNSAFVGNAITITSPVGLFVDPAVNVDNCGFFDNADLVVAGADTGLGIDSVVGDPRFVDPAARDFHLREGSPFIDVGIGNDSIDNTQADIGAYGGQFADPFPFPVPAPDVSDASGAAPPPFSVDVEWQANLGYLVTNSTNDGGYRVYYRQNASGPPYDGTDAGNGTQPSPVDAGAVTTITLADLQPSVVAPAAPQLQSAAPQTRSVVLAWTAVAEADAYRVHWGTAAVSENSADVGDVTSFTVTGLDNGVTYVFAVSALRQPVYHFAITVLDNTQNLNESDFSPESTLAIGPLIESATSNELSASPDETIPIPNLPDKGCFVATAAFGADWAAEVLVLRDFRDALLNRSAIGRGFVEWYYRHGPAAARFIAPRERLRAVVRIALTPAVGAALILSGLTPLTASALVLFGGLLALSILRRWRATL